MSPLSPFHQDKGKDLEKEEGGDVVSCRLLVSLCLVSLDFIKLRSGSPGGRKGSVSPDHPSRRESTDPVGHGQYSVNGTGFQ